MGSFHESLNNCANERVEILINLKEKMIKLEKEYKTLHSKREDLQSRIKMEVRPGKSLKREVKTWLKNVQDIEEKIKTTQQQIVAIFSNWSADELIEELIEEAENRSKSKGVVSLASGDDNAGGASFFGMGGIGQTTINNTDSTTNIQFENIHITNNFPPGR